MIKFAAVVEYLNRDANEIITSTDTAAFKEKVAALKENVAVTRITLLATVCEQTRQTKWEVKAPNAAPNSPDVSNLVVEIFKL